MIERLTLHRWRAFETIDLVFERGTTFVVAPNGVGKTSLLLGMAWAIFGDGPKVKARDCIRAGASSTEAEVALLLPESRRLVIRRTVPEKGKQTAAYVLDGSVIDEDEADRVLHDAFGVRPEVAAQLSMMIGGGHVASERALDLQDHLYDAFGVTSLRTAAGRAAIMAKDAVKHREGIRSAARDRLTDRGTKEAQVEQLEISLHASRAVRADLEAKLEAANTAESVAAAWAAFETRSIARRTAIDVAMAAAHELQLDPREPQELLAHAETEVARSRAEQASFSDRIIDARASARAAESALALLEGDQPACPTCLRPFHGGEFSDAVGAQRAELERARSDEREWQHAVTLLEERLEELDTLQKHLLAIPSEPVRPETDLSDEDPNVLREQALAALRDHDTSVGRLQHERDVVVSDLTADDEVSRTEQAQLSAYRREAVTRAVATALANAVEHLTKGYVEPLSEAMRWRWKALFGEEGLQLRPDGSIVRVVGDRELAWDTLSGGERIWARLVTHLLILGTSTRLPFAWFDEPLEHLDPRARRAVAAALATATRAGGPTQLIVTTYEHAIARQLAADVPEASIRYVRRRPVEAPPSTSPRRRPARAKTAPESKRKRAAG